MRKAYLVVMPMLLMGCNESGDPGRYFIKATKTGKHYAVKVVNETNQDLTCRLSYNRHTIKVKVKKKGHSQYYILNYIPDLVCKTT